jgi:hypothetical protein
MKTHELKTDTSVFYAVMDDEKKFEIRFNDRDFKVGDKLLLRRTKYTGAEMKQGKPLVFEMDIITVIVTHILESPVYGLQDGWVIMSIKHEF